MVVRGAGLGRESTSCVGCLGAGWSRRESRAEGHRVARPDDRRAEAQGAVVSLVRCGAIPDAGSDGLQSGARPPALRRPAVRRPAVRRSNDSDPRIEARSTRALHGAGACIRSSGRDGFLDASPDLAMRSCSTARRRRRPREPAGARNRGLNANGRRIHVHGPMRPRGTGRGRSRRGP